MSTQFDWKKVNYAGDRDLQLCGLLHTGPGATTAVIVCHGFTGSKEGGGRAVAMAEELGELGYATLLFDFSGCGESQGDFADISLSGHIQDLARSVDFCLDLGFSRIITLGRSFGGSTVLCHGGADPRVAGVCAWAAPADLTRVFASFRDRSAQTGGDLVPLSDEKGTIHIKERFFTDLEKHNVPGQAALVAPRSLLLIHGSLDEVVPVHHATAIYHAAGEPKKILILQGADHSFTGRHRDAWEALFHWLKENFSV